MSNFNQVLDRYRDEMEYSLFWRYKKGRLPRIIRWLLERPDLAEALAKDARERENEDATENTTAIERDAA